jgi:hypothetical protein
LPLRDVFGWLRNLFRKPVVATTSVNERTGFTLELSFLDESSQPLQPATARWRAYCATTNRILTDWASLNVGPTGRYELAISATITSILDDSNPSEEKVIAAEANAGTADQVSAEHSIVVKNLRVTE